MKTKLYLNFYFISILLVGIFFLSGSCGKSNAQNKEEYYEDLKKNTSNGDFMELVNIITPDSMAHLICDAALNQFNKSENFPFKIDSFNEAVLQVYPKYSKENRVIFGNALNDYPETLPLRDRVILYYLAGQDDAYRLGYRMGKEKSASIAEEIKIMEEISKENKNFFNKFKKGYDASRSEAATLNKK